MSKSAHLRFPNSSNCTHASSINCCCVFGSFPPRAVFTSRECARVCSRHFEAFDQPIFSCSTHCLRHVNNKIHFSTTQHFLKFKPISQYFKQQVFVDKLIVVEEEWLTISSRVVVFRDALDLMCCYNNFSCSRSRTRTKKKSCRSRISEPTSKKNISFCFGETHPRYF